MDKSKRRRRRENEELRLLVFVLSYSNYELGLYGIRLVDRLIESFPMLIRHVARRKQRHAGRSVLHGASYGLLDLGRDQSMAFRVLDIRLVLPILADEQTAINRASCLARRLLPLSRSEPAKKRPPDRNRYNSSGRKRRYSIYSILDEPSI